MLSSWLRAMQITIETRSFRLLTRGIFGWRDDGDAGGREDFRLVFSAVDDASVRTVLHAGRQRKDDLRRRFINNTDSEIIYTILESEANGEKLGTDLGNVFDAVEVDDAFFGRVRVGLALVERDDEPVLVELRLFPSLDFIKLEFRRREFSKPGYLRRPFCSEIPS